MRKFIKTDKNLIGFKKNFLTGIQRLEKNGRWYWKCKCDCGGETVLREDYFVYGKTKSCGCYGSRHFVYRINRKAPGESAMNSHFNSCKKAAKNRNYSFELTKNEFINLVTKSCFYCNSYPKDSHYNKRAYGALKVNGIDRVDNTIGYTVDNCVPCCKICNVAKATLTQKEFYGWVYSIFKNLNESNKLRLLTDCGLDFSTIWE